MYYISIFYFKRVQYRLLLTFNTLVGLFRLHDDMLRFLIQLNNVWLLFVIIYIFYYIFIKDKEIVVIIIFNCNYIYINSTGLFVCILNVFLFLYNFIQLYVCYFNFFSLFISILIIPTVLLVLL